MIPKTTENKLREIKVFYSDGQERFVNMASSITDKEILDYFSIGRLFNLGDGPKDYFAKVTKVEILDKHNIANLRDVLGDAVKCFDCEEYNLLEIGGEECLNCHAKNLTWIDSDEPEMSIKRFTEKTYQLIKEEKANI